MGINISNTKFVTFDDTHQRRVDTSLEKNPTAEKVGSVTVHHIFRRNNDGDLDRDGNPLVKAMKGMDGYKVVPMYRAMFLSRAREVLETFAGDLEVDLVMPMPSSYGFAREVAVLVSNVAGKDLLESDFIRKRTVAEMLAQYDGHVPDHLSKKLATAYKEQLYTWNDMKGGQSVSMKRIEPKIRTCFQPLTLTDNVPGIAARRVLVVDDLMATGSSISCVSSLLTQGIGCPVPTGMCFLSSL